MSSSRPAETEPTVAATYYDATAERIMPFLLDRALAYTRGSPGALVHQEEGSVIRFRDARDLLVRVEEGAVAFFADPIASSGEVWFTLALEAPGLPFEAVRLGALKLYLVLRDLALDSLIYFDGEGGFRFLWTWGVVDSDELPGGIGLLHTQLGRELQRRLESRFEGTPERDRIGRWLGYEGPVTAWGSAGGEGVIIEGGSKPRAPDRVLFIVGDPSDGAVVPVPWSLSRAGSGAARPVNRADLFRFETAVHGSPKTAMRLRRRFKLPLNFPRAALQILDGSS